MQKQGMAKIKWHLIVANSVCVESEHDSFIVTMLQIPEKL